MKVRHNIPVTLFDYQKSDNPLYSLAKLKIFYVGMTADRRLFTKDFSDELLKTLPYVPVVGYYNSEDEDFEGHSANQNIYGIVPESTGIEFVEEDDKEYAVCDVILYTGRKDETGEIAEKIVGKPHSLELDPDTTTYEVKKDEEGNIDFIEFKTGSLLGLSVLGDDERPAFTGSEFFKNKENDDITGILAGCKIEWAKHNDEINERRGNEEMEFNLSKNYEVFMEKAYDEKFEELAELLSQVFKYFYIIQMFDNYVIIGNYNDDDDKYEYYKVSYSSEGEALSLGEKQIVFPRYLTTEEANEVESLESEEDESFEVNTGNKTNEQSLETENNEDNEEDFEENGIENVVEDEKNDSEEAVDNNEEFTSKDEEEKETNEEGEKTEPENFEKSNTSTLTDSERKELEAFRKDKKLILISSFEEDLEEGYLNDLASKVDELSYDELEINLSKEFTRAVRESKSKKENKLNPIMYSLSRKNRNEEEETANIIKGYVNKH